MSRVMIIDDDRDTTRLLELILSREGYDVKAINDAFSAVDAAVSFRPDLILLDVMMPYVDGFEVCRKLQSQTQLKDTPIVFFTAKGDADTQLTAFQAGGAGFLHKPVHPNELKLKIRALVGSRQAAGG
ncbi:MAG: response regulator [Bacteroidota bacterium]